MIDNKNIALLIAINDYKGTENDLNGCLNDQSDMEKLLSPKYQIVKMKDSECTVVAVKNKIIDIIHTLKSGDNFIIHYSGHGTQIPDKNGDEVDGYDEALYLYDGPLVDDDLGYILTNLSDGVTCLVLLDSCFSGTATRRLGQLKLRYFKLFDIEPHVQKRRAITKDKGMKWCVISGCSENQTSADAFINGRYNGAFTYFLLKAHKEGMSIKEWFNSLRKLLPSRKYDQIPTLEGNSELFNNKIL
jgi:hypothetical protein